MVVGECQANGLETELTKQLLLAYYSSPVLACVAGGIVGARNSVLIAKPLKASGEAARRMGRRTLKYRLHE